MDDPKPNPHDFSKTMETMAEDAHRTLADDVTIPDSGDSEHDIPTLPAGTVVGKYTIDKVLGVGGMGAVYLATQSKPSRQVALKLIRPGVLSSKSIRRFDLEAEILGRLHHPNIAQIHEAGIDQETGSPYFAMEYVAGQELGDYVKDQKLSTNQRLELFVKLCDAIQHAHAKGVIHRDLKPANVLVDQNGEPKVLDFGVARATDANSSGNTMQTNVGQLIGTLYYMSPEQATGDTLNLDTRSDVYALGVVLYEVLTGDIPYDLKDKAIHDAVRIILNTSPTKLSSHDHTLSGDIEIITGKALDKDKDRRYQSVAELSADIRRSLSNQPISARPPSIIYKTSKFIKRNAGLTIAAACVLLIFSIGSGFAVKQWVQRIEARQLALDNMLTTLNEMDVQKGLGPDLAKRLLDLYSEHGQTIFSGDQDSLALFYTNLGEAYHGYEDYKGALKSYSKAYSIRRKIHESPHVLIASALHNVARAEFYLENYDSARVHYAQTLRMREALFSPDNPQAAETARTLDHLGSTYSKLGEPDNALKMYNKAKEIRIRIFGPDSLEVAMSNNSIAWFHVQQNQYDRAVPMYHEALDLLNKLPEDKAKPLWIARTQHSLGNALIHTKQYEQAIEILESSLNLKKQLLGTNTNSVALTHRSLAEVYYHIEDYALATEHAKISLNIRQALDDPNVESAKQLLAIIQSKAMESASNADP